MARFPVTQSDNRPNPRVPRKQIHNEEGWCI